jgi:dienelactone hydrolase
MRRSPLTPVHLLAALGVVIVGAAATGAEPRFAYPVDPSAVRVATNQPYGAGLAMDVYRPTRPASTRLPVLIFFNGATGADRANWFYDGWARAAASHGFVAVLPDLHREAAGQDFEALLSHLTSRADALGIDGDAIAVYCGSGNAWTALPLIEGPAASAVKAAVVYYGAGDVTAFRRDLPMLVVRAGLDRPGMNASVDRFVAAALAENAPVTVLNDPGGYHGLEARNHDAVTRDVIEQSLTFVTRALVPEFQAALRAGITEAAASADVRNGRFDRAVATYADLMRQRPDDLTLSLAYGEALLGAGQYAAACTHYETLRDKDLGPRDRGLPASRACMLAGDADRAIGWLNTIPRRFLSDEEENADVYAPIRDRADFKAVFAPDRKGPDY